MENILIIFVTILGIVGCASNTADLSHFPPSPKVDFVKLDTIQKPEMKSHRFFYNCNFVNDYLIKTVGMSRPDLEKRINKAVQKSDYSVVESSDSLIIAERGATPWEWHTIAVAYVKSIGEISYIYLRTEISQDITCGPNINRAKPIAMNICGQGVKCTEIKEIVDKTKSEVWSIGAVEGGLERRTYIPNGAYPLE